MVPNWFLVVYLTKLNTLQVLYMKINKMTNEMLVKLQHELDSKNQRESHYYRHVAEEVKRRYSVLK
jgi:hypothetical protein